MPKVSPQNRARAKAATGIIGGISPAEHLPLTGIKMLITGSTGTGKTTLACSFPKPLLLIRPETVEDGSRSVRSVKGVDVTPPMTQPQQLDEIVDWQRESGKYKTLVLDGVQFYQDLILQQVLGLSEAPAQLSWGIADQQSWGVVSMEFKERLRRLLRLAESGTNVVIIGGERNLNSEGKAADVLLPSVVVSVTPSAAAWLNFCCDFIVCTFLRQRVGEIEVSVNGTRVKQRQALDGQYEYCLRAGPHPVFTTKFRVSKGTKVPDVIVDPTYAKLLPLLHANER